MLSEEGRGSDMGDTSSYDVVICFNSVVSVDMVSQKIRKLSVKLMQCNTQFLLWNKLCCMVNLLFT